MLKTLLRSARRPLLLLGVSGVCLWAVSLCFSTHRVIGSEPQLDFAELQTSYEADILPLMQEFCTDCHATESPSGELDLERFADFQQVRAVPEIWKKVIDMLSLEEMPPADSPQPTPQQRAALLKWAQSYLDAEALANAGDPGPVVLRRLNNAEYTWTVRDLTHLSLSPAEQFPVDGAAGEGFTNNGAALAMSPALFQKYLDAGKQIAAHAVLLPDGIRFSPHTKSRDWTNEIVDEIRALYARHTSGTTDIADLDQFTVLDPVASTRNDGRVDLTPYIKALITHRERLTSHPNAAADIASEEELNAIYFQHLVECLLGDAPRTALLQSLHDQIASATPEQSADVVAAIQAWQNTLWKFNSVGHMGLIRPWQEEQDPAVPVVTLRRKFVSEELPVDPQTPVLTTLIAGKSLGADKPTALHWHNPRIEFPDRSPISWSQAATIAERIPTLIDGELARTADYLDAVHELSNTDHSLQEVAEQRQLDVTLLGQWTEYLQLGRRQRLQVTGHLDRPLPNFGGHAALSGWGVSDNPTFVANQSNEDIVVSTLTIPGRGVTIHPSPHQAGQVIWQAPHAGQFTVKGEIIDRDDKCGNGALWRLLTESQAAPVTLQAGEFENGQRQAFDVTEPQSLVAGATITLSVEPRNRDHSCDTTQVVLTIQEVAADGSGSPTWNLAGDVVDSVLDGNPHADSHGNASVWHFCRAPIDGEPNDRQPIPDNSSLAAWRAAAISNTSGEELASLASEVQRVCRQRSDDLPAPEETLVQQLHDWTGPLHWREHPSVNAIDTASRRSPLPHEQLDVWQQSVPADVAANLPPQDLLTVGPTRVELNLPAGLISGGELVMDVDQATWQTIAGGAQVQLISGSADNLETVEQHLLGGAPILSPSQEASRTRLAATFEDFRNLFPAAFCYGRIVPVDQTVTLVLFHREDEQLRRLLLSPEEVEELDELWRELRFVSQDALTMESGYEQLMEFATQDSDPSLFEPLREPVRQRAEALRKQLLDSQSSHLQAVQDFARKCYRRPLTEAEQRSYLQLYQALIEDGRGHDEAIRLLLAKALTSPAFLYHIEEPGPGSQATPINDWELASRLSYFLTSSAPDEELRTAAASGELHEPHLLQSQTQRLLQDPRTRRMAIEFGCQWLHIRNFDEHNEKSSEAFPEFAELRDDLYEESIRFFEDLFRNDRSILNILDADYVFVDQTLAQHYGMNFDEVPGTADASGWKRVSNAEQFGRGGILRMASVLSSQSGASRTSPILRGNWVSETLLGEPLPKPPKDVPVLPELAPAELSERQLTEMHTRDESCAKCHLRIDPLGFTLENFDAIGRYRTQDAAGHAIDSSSELMDGTPLSGHQALEEYLVTTRREAFVRQFCRKLLGYALGRGVLLSDEPLLDQMLVELEHNDYRFSTAVDVIVQSPQFLTIRGQDDRRSQP